MDVLAKLLKEAERASMQDDLPDNIFEQIKAICTDKSKLADKESLIEELTDMLQDYEPFADVGCGNESYSTADIQRTVNQILS